jgi:Cu-Zn family superoxide dismutase
MNQTHGSPKYDMPRHVGDLINNVKFNRDGLFIHEYYDCLLNLFTEESIYGRSIVIHEGEDDLGQGGHDDSKTTGHSGKRMGCAIIGRAK